MNISYVVGLDMVSFMQRFSTDEACRAFLERVRWPNGPECPKCASVDITSWLAWFLGCLGRAIGSAEETLSAVLYKAEFWGSPTASR